MESIKEPSELIKTALYLSREAEGRTNALEASRYWLIYPSEGIAPFTIPKDIQRNENLTQVIELKPEFEKEGVHFAAGMSDWSFRRGKGVKTWKSTDLGFDGLGFKTESINMTLGWRFNLPSNLPKGYKADSITLSLAERPDTVSPNGLYAIVKGQRKRMMVNGNKVKLPKEALKDGVVEIEVQPPMPKPGSGTMMRPAWKPWVEGVELKGKLH